MIDQEAIRRAVDREFPHVPSAGRAAIAEVEAKVRAIHCPVSYTDRIPTCRLQYMPAAPSLAPRASRRIWRDVHAQANGLAVSSNFNPLVSEFLVDLAVMVKAALSPPQARIYATYLDPARVQPRRVPKRLAPAVAEIESVLGFHAARRGLWPTDGYFAQPVDANPVTGRRRR